MGEGWGDWYGLNYLHREGLYEKSVVGEYVTGNPTRGIRNWAYDSNPTNFGDIGYDLTGPEVHADGEIWTATLWQLRKTLVVAVRRRREGSEVAARLVTDGDAAVRSGPVVPRHARRDPRRRRSTATTATTPTRSGPCSPTAAPARRRPRNDR